MGPVILPPRWTGPLLAAVFAAAVAFQALAIGTSWGAAYWPFDGVAASAVCVLALLRHRWPVGAAVAATAVAAAATS
ncbi:sensor histidine kinase, partial [Actinomadura logoneensis]